MGFNGPVGLDYALPLARLARQGLSDADYHARLDDLYVMELAALDEMRKA